MGGGDRDICPRQLRHQGSTNQTPGVQTPHPLEPLVDSDLMHVLLGRDGVSDDSYSWIYFFAIMSNHRADFLISSNSSGAGTMNHVSGLHLVEESICHCILHDSSYTVFVEADFLSYIYIADLTIKWNSIGDNEPIKRSESASIMVLFSNNESESPY